eukprot:SAG22_NODE_4359_length_1293_cov_0.906198_1_plen_185_part_10
MMTLTTVGYGDIHPATPGERAFGVFAMLCGGFVFGVIIGNITEIIRTNNPGDMARSEAMGKVHAYLVELKVPQKLSKQLRAYFKHRFAEQSAINNEVVLNGLPQALKKQIAVSCNFCHGIDVKGSISPGILHRVPFFEDLSWWDVVKAAQKLKMFHLPLAENDSGAVQRSDYVMKEGELEFEMYV